MSIQGKPKDKRDMISLGLNISACIIDGLLVDGDNVLSIDSKVGEGSKLSFMIQH